VAELSDYAKQLTQALERVKTTIGAVTQCSDPALALANATIFLDAMGHVVIAWMWLKQAVAAQQGLQNCGEADQNFYQGKLAANQFFFNYELPKIKANLELVAGLDRTCFDVQAEQFLGV
jgi:hypothetical protein